MVAQSKNERKNNHGDTALIKLQNAIIEGQLHANQRLVETHLAKQLGMSRTPVREAIIRLEMLGLATSLPGGRLAVAENTSKRHQDIIEIRYGLESLVAKDFCEHATGQQMIKTKEYSRLSVEAAFNNDPDGYIKYFILSREALMEGCSNKILVALIGLTQDYYYAKQIPLVLSSKKLLRIAQKRDTVIEAYLERNPAKAQRLLKKFIKWESRIEAQLFERPRISIS
jgi:DNA-binding GntR family transcriptional regulator